MPRTGPSQATVTAIPPRGWVVEVDGRAHVVMLDEVGMLAGRRSAHVDGTQVQVTGMVGRAWTTTVPIGRADASMTVRAWRPAFRRNFMRTLRALGADRTLTWFTYELVVGGIRDGSWVETVAGLPADHWSFGRATAGLPCCGMPPSIHEEWCASQVPGGLHADPVLEASLPASVAGQRLARWSVRGWDVLGLTRPLTPDDARDVEADFASRGQAVADLSLAFAGRLEATAPSNSVSAVVLRGSPASRMPPWVGVTDGAHGLDGWTAQSIDGRVVRRGTAEMVRQDEHTRGTPWVYDKDDTRFVILAEDDAWVSEAVRQLP